MLDEVNEAFNPSKVNVNKSLSTPLNEYVIVSFCGSVTENEILIDSFSFTDWDDKPSIIGLPSFSTSKIVITRSSLMLSVPSDASTVISYELSEFVSVGFSKSGFVLKVIAPEVEIESFSASFPDKEYPITSFSISSTVTDKTFNIFSSIDDEETKSLKIGGSFTLITSTSIFADADEPSTLTVYVNESEPKKFSFGE